MKNILKCAVILFTTISLLSGCVDFYTGKRPSDYNNTKWISTNPDIVFTSRDRECIGEITIDGNAMELIIFFDYGVLVSFCEKYTELPNDITSYFHGDGFWYVESFGGKCKFEKNKLTVEITNNSKDILDDSIKIIIFTREDIIED